MTENSLFKAENKKLWRILATGIPEIGVFCENSGRICELGDIELAPGENHWRLWYRQNNVRRPIGKRIILGEDKLGPAIILEKARELTSILGGEVIDHIAFMKKNGLENKPITELRDLIIRMH